MVKDSFPELQSLMNTAERRRSTRIPLDHRNSRILRQSISNYQGHSSTIQEEIVLLEGHIEELKSYESAVPKTLPVEDEQMHEIEKFIKTIGMFVRTQITIFTTKFFPGISRNTQSKSYIISLTECVWKFLNCELWDTH